MAGSASRVAGLASLGNFMWGCDSAAMAGSLLFLVPALGLADHPRTVGALVSTALCGSFCGTLLAGPLADGLGRRPMLVFCAVLFLIGQLLQLNCGKSLALLVVSRCTVGVSEGLIATLVPLFISECSPSHVRGQLAALPQLMGILGMGVTYSCLLGISLAIPDPPWHLMLSIGMIPAAVYLCLLLLVVPESPRWLAHHGRHAEAESILRSLLGPEQWVSGNPMLEELLLLGTAEAEGQEEEGPSAAEKGIMTISPPLSPLSPPIPPLLQPCPALPREGAAEENTSPGQTGGTPRTAFRAWSEVSLGPADGAAGRDGLSHEHRSPQAGHVGGGMEWGTEQPVWRGAGGEETREWRREDAIGEGYEEQVLGQEHSGPGTLPGCNEVVFDRRSGAKDLEEVPQAPGQDIVVIHLPITRGSQYHEAAGRSGVTWTSWLWGMCGICGMGARCLGPCGIWRVALGSSRKEMSERRVLRALVVCILLQVLQQASGISAIFCYLPTLLEASVEPSVGHVAPLHTSRAGEWNAAWNLTRTREEGLKRTLGTLRTGSASGSGVLTGVNAVLGGTGSGGLGKGQRQGVGPGLGLGLALGKQSMALLAGAATAVLMAPFAVLSLYLLDSLGRRWLLLNTIPLVSLSLLGATLSTTLMQGSPWAPLATAFSLAAYCCTFTLGLGPIPNIIASEVFPPKVRGLCVSLSVGVSWLCAIVVTFTLPRLQASLGEQGVYGTLLLASLVTLGFVHLAIPETKGLPLDSVAQLFN